VPLVAVTTEYFFPVNVFAAVTVTPGNNILPFRTLPEIWKVATVVAGGSCATAKHTQHTAPISANATTTITARKKPFNWAAPEAFAATPAEKSFLALSPVYHPCSSLVAAATFPEG